MAGTSDEVQQWLDLADTVYRLFCDDRSYASRGSTVVSRAQDALNAYEHTLSALTRMQARETLWRRDSPDVPLPTGRTWWALCQCRRCRLARLDEQRHPAVYDVQLAALSNQRRRSR